MDFTMALTWSCHPSFILLWISLFPNTKYVFVSSPFIVRPYIALCFTPLNRLDFLQGPSCHCHWIVEWWIFPCCVASTCSSILLVSLSRCEMKTRFDTLSPILILCFLKQIYTCWLWVIANIPLPPYQFSVEELL